MAETPEPAAVARWKASMYMEKLPDDIGPFRELLETYSKIPKEEVDDHLYRIREKAWAVVQFPCLGRWTFTDLRRIQDPDMQRALARLTAPGSPDAMLDVACCLGQVTRKLAASGVDPARLYATDLYAAFLDIGFELFRDRDRFPAGAFVAADMLKDGDDDEGAASLDGKVTMVHASNFFHLFDWAQQVRAAARMVRFIRPGAEGAMIFGTQIGNLEPREVLAPGRKSSMYGQDPQSLQRMWDEVGEKTGTRWKVEAEFIGKLPFQIPGVPEDARYMRYAAYQI